MWRIGNNASGRCYHQLSGKRDHSSQNDGDQVGRCSTCAVHHMGTFSIHHLPSGTCLLLSQGSHYKSMSQHHSKGLAMQGEGHSKWLQAPFTCQINCPERSRELLGILDIWRTVMQKTQMFMDVCCKVSENWRSSFRAWASKSFCRFLGSTVPFCNGRGMIRIRAACELLRINGFATSTWNKSFCTSLSL